MNVTNANVRETGHNGYYNGHASPTRAEFPTGTDWNTPAPVNRSDRPAILNESIIANLPKVLREGVQRLVEPNDKQVFLVTALAVLSGVMPRVKGWYDGKRVGPNLFAFIVGGYGTGKGAMTYAYELIRKIEETKAQQSAQALADWKALPKEERAEEPPPRPDGLVVPANASASAFLAIFNDYKGRAILFETEGDTLAQTLASDHGNYSDILRKSFHHERTSMARRANDERIGITNPELSAVLTGTLDQFMKLVPDARNGLLSRFLYLTIYAEQGFRDVFDAAKSGYLAEFSRLGEQVYNMYQDLTAAAFDEVDFSFTPQQQTKFVENYRAIKSDFIDDTGEDAAGVFHRLALINFRLAMVLSVLRSYEDNGRIMPRVVCSNHDYEGALFFTNVLTEEAKSIYFSMPETDSAEDGRQYSSPEEKKVIELRNKGLSVRKIAEHTKMSKSQVHRITKRYCPSLGQPGTV